MTPKEVTEKTKRKAPIIAAWLILITAWVLMIGGAWLFHFHDNPPIEIFNEPLPLSKDIASPGDNVVMTNDHKRNTDAQSQFTAFWQRDDGLLWEIKQTEITVGSINERAKLMIPLTIPEDIPPGLWKRVNTADYPVNFVANHTVSWESEWIEIEAIE